MPSFYDTLPAELRNLTHREAVERYAAQAETPARAVAGMTREQLVARPGAGTWSVQEIVVHMLDSDLTAAYRMKRTLAEERPVLDVYDETRFAQRLGYHEIDLGEVVELFRLNRRMVAGILRRAGEADFSRVAQHPEAGDVSLAGFVRLYVHHVNHHLKFVREKRAMLGVPLVE
ncbi:MAG: DinB family protein [Phycisphaerales bacterium]|nr:DinB family protein [Phycisphaerales bacterium]